MSGPDRLPGSIYNILFSLLCYCLAGFALVEAQRSYFTILAQITLEQLLLVLVCFLTLKWKELLSRLTQTFSALLGINLVITLASIPIYKSIVLQTTEDNTLSLSASIIYLSIVTWNLVVMSSIFSKSFEINRLAATMIAISYYVLYMFMVSWLI